MRAELGTKAELKAPSGQDKAWLRRLIARLVQAAQVIKHRAVRPDLRQARAWDWMSI
jgi:hypothetical protein